MLGELEESIGISFRIIPPILLIIWAILYNKNKKIIILLPYLSMYISLPLFAILSEVIYLLGYRYIVNIFLFKIIFLIVSILVVIEGMVLSKKINKLFNKILYILSIIIVNLVLFIKVYSYR